MKNVNNSKRNESDSMCNAPFWVMPTNQNPEPHWPAFYGSTRVSHPTNERAKNTNQNEVMNQVMRAK